MTSGKREIENGIQYDSLFPKSPKTVNVIKRGARLQDTINFLPEVIQNCSYQTEKISEKLKGATVLETSKNIWNWVYKHIQYEEDEKGKEQIRTPQRTWADRVRGVDCDDMTVLICCMLENLKIPYLFRVAMYDAQKGYQHVYPVALDGKKEIIIDCVLSSFNYQVPPLKKIDTNMDIDLLHGFTPEELEEMGKLFDLEKLSIDGKDLLFSNMGSSSVDNFFMGDLGRKKLKDTKIFNNVNQAVKHTASTIKTTAQHAGSGVKTAVQNTGKEIKNAAQTVAKKSGTAIHNINKYNPTTALLRLGVLTALKQNMMYVAENLRQSLITDDEAKRRGYNMGKFQRLKSVLSKLENIFYTAGGKKESFIDAIKNHKGKRTEDDLIAGLRTFEEDIRPTSRPLPLIIGYENFNREMSGVTGLGEPVTATALAAATTVMTTIAALIKTIGKLKSGNNNSTEDNYSASGNDADTNSAYNSSSSANEANSKNSTNSSSSAFNTSQSPTRDANDSATSASNDSTKESAGNAVNSVNTNATLTNNANASKASTTQVGMWEGVKTWVSNNKTTAIAIGVGIASLAYLLIKRMQNNNTETGKGLSGHRRISPKIYRRFLASSRNGSTSSSLESVPLV